MLTAIGLALGVVGSVAAAGMFTRFLYGVGRNDATTYSTIVLLIGTVGLTAAVVPAIRATRMDPAAALRE